MTAAVPALPRRGLPARLTLDDPDPVAAPVSVSVPVPPGPAPAHEVTAAAAPVDMTALIDEVRRTLSAERDPGALAAYRTYGRFCLAMRRAADNGDLDTVRGQLAAFADQITGESPGVILPVWVKDVKGVIERAGRAIAAFGGLASLPDSGMTIDWPFYDGDLDAIVGAQATELTDILNVDVPIKRGTAGIATYAGGSNVSWQLIERSDPAYLDVYTRILLIAYTRCIDKAFVDNLVALGTGSVDLPLAAGLTARDFAAALFDASSQVDDVTGTPATAVLVSPDVWKLVGGLPDLYPTQYGTNNARGTADAATLRVEVAGLPITSSPYVPPATAIVGNTQAAQWHGEPGRIASADEVLKLGRQVAVWGMGGPGVYLPAGIVKITDVTPLGARTTGGSGGDAAGGRRG